MELALYCPLCGYYEKKEDTPGRRGDFYTSVSVGPLFGQMLAFQFADWLEQLAIPGCRLQIVEAGAHDGQLAKDILEWMRRQRPALFDKLTYRIIEPSSTRQSWQREKLAQFAPHIEWLNEFPRATAQDSERENFTIVFSNELLDAFPVHRLGWDAKNKKWFEWGVTTEGERFVWTRLPLAIGDWPSRIVSPELLEILPENFTTEINPAAEQWWRDAANSFTHGKLLTFDYGLTAEEFFQPQRASGTLRAYLRHRIPDDPLANPGEQDLTAHVNFSAIQQAGERAGLKTETFATQSQFLTRIAEKIWKPNSGFGEWTPEQTRQFQTLAHPNHLGRAFRVLVQSRNS